MPALTKQFFDNCIVDSLGGRCVLSAYVFTFNCMFSYLISIFYGQATKGVRWMPRQREAMKDVVNCDKLRGVVKQALIRRFPNGETRQG